MLLDAIAHEFKTPLTSIKAASTSILGERSLPAHVLELETIIDEEADRMNLLVTEAVRMSSIDAGKVRLHRTPVDIAELLRCVLAQFATAGDGRELMLHAGGDLPRAWADRDLACMAIRQLIDNSLKYSPPGTPIDVSADCTGDRAVIHVRDKGSGIPEREREHIFEKFYRRQGPKSQAPGTGLGLYIAREIVRTHGGDIWIEGEPGADTEFCVSLPLAEKGSG